MLAHFGGVQILLLTAAVVVTIAEVEKVPLSEDAIPGSERHFGENDVQDGFYHDTGSNAKVILVDNHVNFKPSKLNSHSLAQNSEISLNSGKNYKLYGQEQGLGPFSSDPNNEAALGDGFFDLFKPEEADPKRVGVQSTITDLNKAELQENPHEQEVMDENEPSRMDEQFNFSFNYTIDISDMSLACQDGRVNLKKNAYRIIRSSNHVLNMFLRLRTKYANWAFDASWEDYSHLIQEDLGARYVPLLPLLPEDSNNSVIKLNKHTASQWNFLLEWIWPGPDTETSLERVLRDAYSVMTLCIASADYVLLEQVLSNYPLIKEMTLFIKKLEGVKDQLWNVLSKCNVDPNQEPLRHILDSPLVFERETVDDIKRRGFLTIHHTEKALLYVVHILKSIDPTLEDLFK